MSTATKKRPILFSGPMVRAILAGRKTQTRRVAKPPAKAVFLPEDYWKTDPDEPGSAYLDDFSGRLRIWCPYGVPGDQLWVRETFREIEDPAAKRRECTRITEDDDGERHRFVCDYAADGPTRIMDKIGKPEWQPSIHMPRRLSRIMLEITGVRVERLQDITEADAQAEGFDGSGPVGYLPAASAMGHCRYDFANLWDQINGKTYPWSSNPWVWVIKFRRA